MSIYITQQKKEELEVKMAELEKSEEEHLKIGYFMGANMNHGFIDALKLILSEAIILPIEESWERHVDKTASHLKYLKYPNGVIIKPKES